MKVAKWQIPRKLRGKDKRFFKLELTSDTGVTFRVRATRWITRPNKFSISLWAMVDGHEYYLVRMEGFHIHHNNKFEKKEKQGVQFVPANTYHVHRITERYQKLALAMPTEFEELEYAEPTPWFNSADSAFTYFRDYCHIVCVDAEFEFEWPLFQQFIHDQH